MFRLKKLNNIVNTTKFASLCLVMMFLVGFSFGFEKAPLNVLYQWVDNVEKNVKLSQTQGKAVVKDLYNNSLKQVQSENIKPMLNSVKQSAIALNDSFLCDLRDNDVLNILYQSNDEFRKNLKSISSNFVVPTKNDMVESCSKLIACISNDNKATKIADSLAYCKSMVGSYYLNQYKNSASVSSLSQDNKGSDAFWNKSLDDSSYDILNDIYALARILFDEVQEPTEVLFYEMPSVNSNYWGSNNNAQTSAENNRYSPYYTINTENDNGSSGGNDNGGNTGENGGTGTSIAGGQASVIGNIDDEIGEFIQETTYTVEGSDGASFLGNQCVSGFDIEGYSGYSYTGVITGVIPGYPQNPTQYLEMIVQDIGNMSCNSNGICESWESTTCQDCIPSSGGSTYPEEMMNFVEENPEFANYPQVLACFSSCNSTPCTATSCDRLACYAKCLCLSYESPIYDPIRNPGLGALFKLKFCVVPVMDHKVVTSKKVYNLASVFSEINAVIQNLRNSGQLMLNKKTREFLDAGFQNNNFAEQISFSIDGYEKMPESKGSEKQEMENQIKLNTAMMENILGFEKDNTVSGKGRNKYIIKGGTVENGSVLDTASANLSTYMAVDPTDIVSSLQTEHLSNMKTELSTFLEANLRFWIATKDVFESLNVTADSLLNKKN